MTRPTLLALTVAAFLVAVSIGALAVQGCNLTPAQDATINRDVTEATGGVNLACEAVTVFDPALAAPVDLACAILDAAGGVVGRITLPAVPAAKAAVLLAAHPVAVVTKADAGKSASAEPLTGDVTVSTGTPAWLGKETSQFPSSGGAINTLIIVDQGHPILCVGDGTIDGHDCKAPATNAEVRGALFAMRNYSRSLVGQ